MPLCRQQALSRGSARGAGQRGFTLVELAITLVVLGVLMAMAIPGFRYVHNSGRLSAAANDVVASLQAARMEAVRRNGRVVLCSSADGASCSGDGSSSGWLVFADANGDSVVDDDEEVLLVNRVAPPLTLAADDAIDEGIVVFRADGMARDKGGELLSGQFRVCIPSTVPSDNIRNVEIGTGGRVRMARDGDGGECE